MKNIFEEHIQEAATQIMNSNDRELFENGYENRVLESYKIKTPYLEKDKIKVTIQEEIISFHNAPPGVSFTPGQTMEVAYFQVPIAGDLDLFSALVRHQFYNRQVKYINGKTLIYREYSTRSITGNQELIDTIKQRAKIEIDTIQAALDEFKKKATDFNEGELKNAITNFVTQERERRKTKSDSENQLNPFA